MGDLNALADLTRNLGQEINQSIEEVAKAAGLDQNPSYFYSFGTNALAFSLALALECQIRGIPFSKLMDETHGPTKEMTDAALKITKFCYEEIVVKRKPDAVRLRIDPEKKEGS